MPNAVYLADVLREAGQEVVEEPGWKTRGRGKLGTVRGILVHHTGPGGRDALRRLIRDGRSDLPGPLSQMFLDKEGVYYLCGAGKCNHAGKGKWQGITNGNSEMLGIECQNAGDGKDPWPDKQLYALTAGCDAILQHLDIDEVMVGGHKEYALPKGRKIDPTIDMVDFREALAEIDDLTEGKAPAVRLVDPVRSMLRKGSQGTDVKQLQRLLGITADGAFGPKTEAAVKKFQQLSGLIVDGHVGPKTWDALLKKEK